MPNEGDSNSFINSLKETNSLIEKIKEYSKESGGDRLGFCKASIIVVALVLTIIFGLRICLITDLDLIRISTVAICFGISIFILFFANIKVDKKKEKKYDLLDKIRYRDISTYKYDDPQFNKY